MGFQRPKNSRPELIGYSDRPGAAPGERMRFMVSTEFAEFEAQLVRLLHGDENPAGPGAKSEELDHEANGRYAGQHQDTPTGSYVHIPGSSLTTELGSFSGHLFCRPSIAGAGHDQAMLAVWGADGGCAVGIDTAGRFYAQVNGAQGLQRATVSSVVRQGCWYSVAGGYDAESGQLMVRAEMVESWPVPDRVLEARVVIAPGSIGAASDALLIAAGSLRPISGGRVAPVDVYNGRIESPSLFDRLLQVDEIAELSGGGRPDSHSGLVGWWDFTDAPAAFATATIRDASGHGLEGVAVNYPTRALLGRRWDRSVFGFEVDSSQYSAIEFHDDDIEDCGWNVAVEVEFPADLPSGVYALRLRAEGVEDCIPFFVRPPVGANTADVCFLASTFTYQAYANESILATSSGTDWSLVTDIEIVPDQYDVYSWEHPEFGYSIYDSHSDGSGINYSSWLRPIVNMRPNHRYWVTGAPRHFAADLYVTDWLTVKGLHHDVVTDHDLHADGASLLSGYKVVITSSHPEYWSEPMQIALEAYLQQGGRLVYLGGNGFYWVTAQDPHRPHLIEVRRGYASSRTWNGHPAETCLASTGEMGGIWRFRGRSPNEITGVGFAAQGWSTKAPGFRRLEDSRDPRAAFIFEGVEDEVIGDFGLVMDGAAGDEIDRCDVGLGTPPNALRLATSQGMHSRFYLVTHEDLLVTSSQLDGTNNENVRADMMYFERDNGSAVFSMPAIGVSSSLSHGNYDNNVSTILMNVLERFRA
jgi:N,N-dimethylformamidase